MKITKIKLSNTTLENARQLSLGLPCPVIRNAYTKNIETGKIVFINCGTNEKVNTFLRSTFSN